MFPHRTAERKTEYPSQGPQTGCSSLDTFKNSPGSARSRRRAGIHEKAFQILSDLFPHNVIPWLRRNLKGGYRPGREEYRMLSKTEIETRPFDPGGPRARRKGVASLSLPPFLFYPPRLAASSFLSVSLSVHEHCTVRLYIWPMLF